MYKKKLKIYFFFFFFLLLVLLMDYKGLFNWLKSPVLKLTQPIRHKLYLIKLKTTEENLTMSNDAKFLILKAEVKNLTNENARLRKLLGTKLPPNWHFIPAKILSFFDNKIIIDVGSEMGVEKGQEVMALQVNNINNGVLIGEIKSVSCCQSEVESLKIKDQVIKVITENNVNGDLVFNGDNWELINVLVGESLKKGELVMTKGGDGRHSGLVVGKLSEIKKQDIRIYQKAVVDLVLDLKSLETLFVVKN